MPDIETRWIAKLIRLTEAREIRWEKNGRQKWMTESDDYTISVSESYGPPPYPDDTLRVIGTTGLLFQVSGAPVRPLLDLVKSRVN